MNLKHNHMYHGFQLTKEEYVKEIQGVARIFEHVKSGATLIQINNQDTHKVFSISFNTPPRDNTGVAHIIEHAVCCASNKYPLKDTFVEMDKGSLNTTMNACTYKDMTMYYCASQNHQDLLNLMDVYMDLVFHPLIYSRPYIFKQEGWHYSLLDEEEEITYNGIVYNEMKGEYAEPSTIMDAMIHKTLFPDTLYQYDSGGVPEEIIKLTEEEFLNFHREYYKPSNCTIYVYGDGNLLDQLALLDSEYLQHFDKKIVNLDLPLQKPFKRSPVVHEHYAITPDEDPADKTMLALSFVVGETVNMEERIAFQVLEHMLLKSAASPLSEALVGEEGIGKVVEEGGYDTGKKQPTFTIMLSGTNKEHHHAFKHKVFEVLETLVQEGINPSLLEASLSTITFALQEADTPYEPKGLIYCEDIVTSKLYGGDPLAPLYYEAYLANIVAQKDKGYFEALIRKYFLENKYSALLILEPDKKIAKKAAKLQQKTLKAYKQSLTAEETTALIQMNNALDDLQEAETAPEDLALLPSLTLQDIQKKVEPLCIEEGLINKSKILFQPLETNDIVYLHLLFDTTMVSEANLPYLGLLANTLTYLSTTHYKYNDLENEINTLTGGLNCSINAYADCENTDQFMPLFKISVKVLSHKFTHLITLLQEILTQGCFTEKAKLKELLEYIRYEMERTFTSSPDYRATRRLYSYFSRSAVYEDKVGGIDYYHFLTKLCDNFDAEAEAIMIKLETLYRQIFQTNHMVLSFTAGQKDYDTLLPSIKNFVACLPSNTYKSHIYDLTPKVLNEGYLTAGEVQTIAKGFNFRKAGFDFRGSLGVVSNILNSTYLWDKVRLQGGAYGCDLTMSSDGNLVLCSYCDPGLTQTLDVYNGIGDYLRQLDLSHEELLRYVIGTIGGLDVPLTCEQKSEKATAYYLCNVTHELLQKERDEILQTTNADIVAFADLFDTLAKDHTLCVIGSEQSLNEQSQLFSKLYTI